MVPVCSVGNYQAYLRAACCVCEVVPGALRFTEEGDVLGWQALVLARPQRCERCALLLGRGDSAYASVTSRGVGAAWRCEDCVAA